ncbi:MAG: hypothetical protein MJD61_04920, partial [Proteobacteria bacterium]|nr:hypothetical protein [Pseudomonadota bacterium]
MLHVAIDLGSKQSQVCVRDAQGKIVEEGPHDDREDPHRSEIVTREDTEARRWRRPRFAELGAGHGTGLAGDRRTLDAGSSPKRMAAPG